MSGPRRRFRFIKEIAEGGFGKVYLAEQLSADGFSRIVAVKLLHAKWSSHDEVVMRTRDEARLLGLIRHQNIVRVDDLTSIDGKCALVMEYLEGVDLKAMLQHCQERGVEFPRSALFEIMISSASALDAAYNGRPLQGGEPLRVIHRDIKPSNIFVTVNGAVKVLDFGTARANFAQREAKTQALAFGSQGYMAPERMLGEEDTPAADIFSLGVTLYELLTLESFGRIPPRPNKFVAKVEERIASIPLEGDPEWVDQVRDTLRLMLAYEPSERPTAGQLIDIFELLAQNANDMGMRRFCRTMVAEAKAGLPDLESGDPLTGQTIDEDVSEALGMGIMGVPEQPDGGAPSDFGGSSDAFGAPPPPPPPTSGGLGAPPPPPPPTAQSLPPPKSIPPQDQRLVAQTILPQDFDEDYEESQEADVYADSDDGGGGGALKFVVAGGALLVLGVVVVGVAGVIAFGAYSMSDTNGGGGTTDTIAETQAPENPPDMPQGGVIVSQDTRTDVGRSKKTVLAYSDASSGGKITITGGVGFKAEWDGKGDFDLGDLAEGKYRTNVVPASGGTIRNKTFEVEKGKTCNFTFDVGKKSWGGACK